MSNEEFQVLMLESFNALKKDINNINLKLDKMDKRLNKKIDNLDKKVDKKINIVEKKLNEMEIISYRIENQVNKNSEFNQTLKDTTKKIQNNLQDIVNL